MVISFGLNLKPFIELPLLNLLPLVFVNQFHNPPLFLDMLLNFCLLGFDKFFLGRPVLLFVVVVSGLFAFYFIQIFLFFHILVLHRLPNITLPPLSI